MARRPWLALFLLGALFTRALIPVGYMPGAGGLIICPGYAPLTAATAAHDMPGMDMSGSGLGVDHSGKAPSHDSMGICPFAAAATVFAFLQAPTAVSNTPLIQVEVKLTSKFFISRSRIAPTRLPRGPPSLV